MTLDRFLKTPEEEQRQRIGSLLDGLGYTEEKVGFLEIYQFDPDTEVWTGLKRPDHDVFVALPVQTIIEGVRCLRRGTGFEMTTLNGDKAFLDFYPVFTQGGKKWYSFLSARRADQKYICEEKQVTKLQDYSGPGVFEICLIGTGDDFTPKRIVVESRQREDFSEAS